jgi:hypothetical protein
VTGESERCTARTRSLPEIQCVYPAGHFSAHYATDGPPDDRTTVEWFTDGSEHFSIRRVKR